MPPLLSRAACALGLCLLLVSAAAAPAEEPDDSSVTLVRAKSSDVTAAECPGVAGGVCGKACQLRLCGALRDLYHASNNASDPWDNERGWELTTHQPCEALVARGSPRAAVYCSWFGVTCCTPDELASGHCSAVNAITALEMPINNLNISVRNPVLLRTLTALHDCGMTVLNLEANNLVDEFGEGWEALHGLTVLNFGNCWVAGTLPEALRSMRNLTLLNLATNWLNGTLPSWLSDLRELRVLNLGSNGGGNKGSNLTGLIGPIPPALGSLRYLRELNLEANSLSGTLPDELCTGNTTGDASNLLLLNVRANRLNGSASAVERCGNLVQLDISGNDFTGSLPASIAWDELASYRAGNNRLSGRFPVLLARSARILENLDVSHNQLTGVIPSQVLLMNNLKTFVIASNRFSGTMTEDVYFLPALTRLDMSDNQFVGTVPPAIGLTYSLTGVDISNNPGLTGWLPPQMGLLAHLQEIRAANTSLSCAGITRAYAVTTNNSCTDPMRCTSPRMYAAAGAETRCAADELLPCFLDFGPHFLPRDDESNMRCRPIRRRGPDEARAHCGGADERTGLGEQAAKLPSGDAKGLEAQADATQSQQWYMDPVYYQFQACECLLGYREEWRANHTLLTCVYDPPRHQTHVAPIVGGVAGGVIVLALLLAWRQYLTTRPRWLRERIMQAKRSRGAPKAAKPGDKVMVSVVVTDVKDFADLTRQYPELMAKAMGGHNNILRKACHTHAGYVMDQEGDSWTIAFHDAEDAVAFSLQVQQALALRAWGLKYASAEPPDGLQDLTHMREAVFSTKFSHVAGHSVTSTAALRTSAASSSFGMMGGDGGAPLTPMSAAAAAAAAAAAGGSFASQNTDPSFALMRPEASLPSRANASFTSRSSAAERASRSGADQSFTQPQQQHQLAFLTQLQQQQQQHQEQQQQQRHSVDGTGSEASAHFGEPLVGPLWPPASVRTKVLGGLSSALQQQQAQQQACASPRGARTAAEQQERPQDSFTDMHAPRDAHAANSRSHPQLVQLARAASDDHAVAASGMSGGSWACDTPHLAGGLPGMPPLTSRSSFGSAAASFGLPLDRMASLQSNLTVNSKGLELSSSGGSRLWNAGVAMMRRFSHIGRAGAGGQLPTMGEATPKVQLMVRIGVATGALPYGVDLNNCGVKDRAKEYVSEVANGGQVLMDEPTFRCIKDSLSVLGTVDDSGYDDRLLQQLLHTQAVNRLQHHVLCGQCDCFGVVAQREASFSSQVMMGREPQDYDNDALVVHMGGFDAPFTVHPADRIKRNSGSQSSSPSAAGDDTDGEGGAKGGGDGDGADGAAAAAGAGAAAPAPAAPADGQSGGGGRGSHGGSRDEPARRQHKQRMQLQLYTIAAPGMRRHAETTAELDRLQSWNKPVVLKRGWVQIQKGYFDAPGARLMDLSPVVPGSDRCQPTLPEVTIVFAQVVSAPGFTYKRNRSDTHALNKAIRRCMLQMLDEMPLGDDGRDGYLCRCHEADLKYMIAFKAPYRAVQWCMLMQEALMYINWPPHVLAHPGFEEVLDPMTGLPLFRGPRMRMGLSEGCPNSVLPDHAGRANYYGHAVNRAARFMDAAAHGGQIVTDIDMLRKLVRLWAAQDCIDAVVASSESGNSSVEPLPSTAASDGKREVGQQDAVLHMLASRSQSETSGHCGPSAFGRLLPGAGRMGALPAAAQPHASQHHTWLQRLQRQREARQLQHQAAREDAQQQHKEPQQPQTPQLQAVVPGSAAAAAAAAASGGAAADQLARAMSSPTTAASLSSSPAGFSCPLPGVGLSGSSFTRQLGLPPPSGGSFTRQQLAGAGGSFTRQQLAASGSSFTRQQLAASGSSFTRQQLAASGSSFTRQQLAASGSSFTRHPLAGSGGSFTRQQQLAASGSSFTRQLGPSGSFGRLPGSGHSSFSRQHLAGPMGTSFTTFPERLAAPSFTAAQLGPVVASGNSFVMQVPAGWQELLAEAGAGVDVCEAVTASWVGTFQFKGSGACEMVQLQQSSLLARRFPDEPPKGKGVRIMAAEGPVAGLEPVLLSVPPRLLAARQAFRHSRRDHDRL